MLTQKHIHVIIVANATVALATVNLTKRRKFYAEIYEKP